MKEELLCNCKTAEHHHEYEDKNKETIVECKECKMFLKFPATVKVEETEAVAEKAVAPKAKVKATKKKVLKD